MNEEPNKNTKSTGSLQKPVKTTKGGTSNRTGGAPNTVKVDDSRAQMPGVSGTNAAQEKGMKDILQAKRRYRNRRSAFRILEKWAATPEGQLTEEQRVSVAWARSTVGCGSSERDPVPKRQRSQDEMEVVDSKRVKLLTGKKRVDSTTGTKLFSDVVREQALMLAVIDESQEDGSIKADKWREVYNALNLVFLKVLRENPGPPPSCRDAGWYQGRVKLTACSDQRSADLYKKAIAEVGEVWPGAKLKAVSREGIPSRPRARVWLPSEPVSPSEVLEIIQASNPGLPTGNWKIVKQEEAKGGSRLSIMVINKESLAPLEKTKGVIDFGFGSITLNVYKRDGAEARTGGQPGTGGNPPMPEEDTTSGVGESGGSSHSESSVALIQLDEEMGDMGAEAGQPMVEEGGSPARREGSASTFTDQVGSMMTSVGGRGGETDEPGTSPDTGN